MTQSIHLNGRYLSPQRAATERLALDTPLVCPECASSQVVAKPAQTTIRLGGEAQHFIPRQQDRRCLACGHRWTSVLPPEIYNDSTFRAGLSR
jgi:hypothetical protein